MTRKRLWQTFRLWTMLSSTDRVRYLREKKIFGMIGENVTIMDRKIPLYAKLIRIHNNVRIASNVTFVTHDIIHSMINGRLQREDKSCENVDNKKMPMLENVGCIEIMDNVFVGTNVTILNGVRIGPNAVVAAGAVVAKDVPENTVVGGVPARVICTLDAYLEKHKNAYPQELKPRRQEVSDELAEFLWSEFEKRTM